MLNVTVLCVGTLKEPYLRDAIAEYEKRLEAYCRFSIKQVRNDQLIPALPHRAYKIALCVEGTELSSEQLAKTIGDLPVRGISEIVFVIGDSDGLAEEVKASCDYRLSFSRLTFPHQLMRVILCEQIYRSFNILSGGKYHK